MRLARAGRSSSAAPPQGCGGPHNKLLARVKRSSRVQAAPVASVEGAVEPPAAALFGADYNSAEVAEQADWADRALDSLDGD